jgi:hypothetical protein
MLIENIPPKRARSTNGGNIGQFGRMVGDAVTL